MTAVPVLWWTSNPGVAARGYWDQALLEDLLSGALWRVPGGLRFEPHFHMLPEACERGPNFGAVVVVPGRMENGGCAQLQRLVADMPWVLLIVTSDEESSFPWWEVEHPRMLVWAQTPHPDRPQPGRQPGPASPPPPDRESGCDPEHQPEGGDVQARDLGG